MQSQTTQQHLATRFCRKFLVYFGALSQYLFIEIRYNNTENSIIEWFRKEKTMFFPETKVYSLNLSLVSFFLVSLVCLKSVNWEMPGKFQVRSQEILWSQALKRLLRVQKHPFRSKKSNKFKNGVDMVWFKDIQAESPKTLEWIQYKNLSGFYVYPLIRIKKEIYRVSAKEISCQNFANMIQASYNKFSFF
jgi:hypothetical protein